MLDCLTASRFLGSLEIFNRYTKFLSDQIKVECANTTLFTFLRLSTNSQAKSPDNYGASDGETR